jgi:hypothetical protein
VIPPNLDVSRLVIHLHHRANPSYLALLCANANRTSPSSHDTTPSILSFNIQAHSGEHAAKRTKLSQEPTSTIADKLAQAQYSSLDALVKDVDTAASELLTPLKAKESNLPSGPYGRLSTLSASETALWNGTIAFQKHLEEMVRAETQRTEWRRPATKATEQPATNGVTVKMETDDGDMFQNGANVLTLFANAPAPKQLFSSLQQPIHVTTPKQGDAAIDVTPPFRESGLPNFIGTTKIPALGLDDSMPSKEKAPKLGEIFAPPANLPRLQPPKPSKQMVAKGNTITFVPTDKPTKPDSRSSYNWCSAKQTVGQWLGYGGVDTPQEPISPQAKRKQRDRALSTGEAYLVPSESEKLALKQAKEDALFRKVYGSFAPSHDDSGAVVPEQIRNEIWWTKTGERFAQKSLLFMDPALLAEDAGLGAVEDDAEAEDAKFKEAVESFDPELLGLDKLEVERTEEKEVDEILVEISNLLETLSGYQRVRNSSLATSARTTVGQNSPLTEMVGSPSTPSTAELEVYKTLKAQLAVLVLSLPPYAVARLNGDQLEELNIKTSIVVETDNPRGVMAEDEASRAKNLAYAAATGPSVPPLTRASSGNSYQNHPAGQYNRAPVAPAAGRPGGSGYYPPQAQGRPAPIPFQRSSSGVQTFSGGYPTTAPRPGYPQQSYPQTTPRPGYQQQQSSNHYFQQLQHVAGPVPKPNYNQQYYQGTPQTQSRNYQQTPQSAYQRPQNGAPVYNNYPQTQSPQVRTASPHTAGNAAAPPQYNQPPRPAYNTPGPPQTGRNSFYQPPAATHSGQFPGTPASVGPSGFHSTMSATEQHSMLNRMQQQARMAAPAQASMTPTRQSSGTPQPPQANGTYPAAGQQTTPMVAQSS